MKTSCFRSNRLWLALGCVLIAFACAFHRTRGAESVSAALQQGLLAEETDGNLEAAARSYEEAVRLHTAQRAEAATALFRLAEAQRRLGRTPAAQASYERLVREFPEQTRLVELSRAQLPAGLPTAGEAAVAAGRAEQERLLREDLSLAEKLAAEAKTKADLGVIAPLEALVSKREVLRLKRQLLELTDPDGVASRGEQRRMFAEEVGYAEQWAEAADRRLQNGKGSTEESILARRAVLEVKRELAAFESRQKAPGAPSAGTAASAAEDEDAQEIRRLEKVLRNSPDLLNAKQGKYTPLDKAAVEGRVPVLKYLLDNGADVSTSTPLHLAAQEGHRAAVEFLLSRGLQVDGRNRDGLTPLHMALGEGRKAVAEVLLKAGASVEARRPGALALSEGRYDYLSYNQGTPLHWVALRGQVPLIDLLLQYKADIQATNAAGWTPLHVAIRWGQGAAFRRLLERGADVNAISPAGVSPLELVFVPQQGSEQNFVSSGMARHDFLKELLAKGADPNRGLRAESGQYRPLQLAIRSGDAVAVEMLLQAKADPNAESSNMSLPLTIACQWGTQAVGQGTEEVRAARLRMVDALLRAGARPNAVDARLSLPLVTAVESGDHAFVARLLAGGVEPNRMDPQIGCRALDQALGSPKLVKVLLENGADPNLRDTHRMTPLERLAAMRSTPSYGQSIRAAGAPVPEDPARAMDEVRALLVQHGAREDLADFEVIRVARGSEKFSEIAFHRSTMATNRFTLLEVLAVHYGLVERPGLDRIGAAPSGAMPGRPSPGLPSPDLANLTIHRPIDQGWTNIPVNALGILKGTQQTNDVWLDWGDIVEIPKLATPGGSVGLPGLVDEALCQRMERTATVVMNGERHPLKLAPQRPGSVPIRTPARFDASAVLQGSGRIQSLADLRKLRVRRAAGNGQEAAEFDWGVLPQMTVRDDLWVRDGDEFVIAGAPAAVPKAPASAIFFGEVRGVIPLVPGERLTVVDALLRLGVKTTVFANLKKVRILRVGRPEPIAVDVERLLRENDRTGDVPLEAGDRVEVPAKVL